MINKKICNSKSKQFRDTSRNINITEIEFRIEFSKKCYKKDDFRLLLNHTLLLI